MKHQKRFKIKGSDFETFDVLERLVREHNYQAQILGNEINRKKLALVKEFDPEMEEAWKQGFVDIGIDWETKEMVVSRTVDPVKKALEVADLIKKNKQNHAN